MGRRRSVATYLSCELTETFTIPEEIRMENGSSREPSRQDPGMPRGDSDFASTRWSLVRAAGLDEGHSGREALATLCEAYWYPLYVFVRRRGYASDQAQDLTQDFFTHLIQGNRLSVADPQRGRFRSFLLQSMVNFLATERRKQTAQKRGGGKPTLSLDFQSGESRYLMEPADLESPERLFERRWALTLLEHSLRRLREEYASSGRGDLFAALEPHLQGAPDALPLTQLAADLHMSEGAIKVAAHRLRRRYREVLRAEVAETVSATDDIDQELRELLRALSP